MTLADLNDFAERWLLSLQTDLVRYAVFAVGVWLVLWVLLAGALRRRKIRPDTPKPRQLLIEFAASLRSIAIFSTVGLATFALERAGLLPGPARAEQWGPLWGAAWLVLMIVAHDAYFYWTHRAIHDPRLFRIFHRRHHRSHNPSPFTAYSFDLGEALIQALFVPLWMLLMPTTWPMVGLFMLHQIARNTLGHSGYELFPARCNGRPVFDFLTTTTHHDIHHAEAGWNYGLYFTWWDRLMGTEHPDYRARFAAAAGRARHLTAPLKSATLALALVLGATVLAPDVRAQTPAEIADDWATEGLGGVVRLAPCASDRLLLCGRLVWVWNPGEVRAGAVGALMLRDFRWRHGAWRDGVLHNPEDGHTYRGAIMPDGDLLRLRGCAGPFCQTQAWRRLSSIPRP